MSLTPRQQRLADQIIEDMIAEGWEPDEGLVEAVCEAFLTGRGEWNGLVIEVSRDDDQVQ